MRERLSNDGEVLLGDFDFLHERNLWARMSPSPGLTRFLVSDTGDSEDLSRTQTPGVRGISTQGPGVEPVLRRRERG